MALEVGAILEGKVTGITKFGVFVALPEGKSGLVHISEIANTFVNDVHDYVQDGQTVKKGDVLVILEAMKMENEIQAPCDGKITGMNVRKGDTVETQALICTIA